MRLSVVEVSGKRGKGAGDGRMIDGSRVYEEQGTSHLYSTLYILRFILVCKAAYTTLHSLTHRVAARAGPARQCCHCTSTSIVLVQFILVQMALSHCSSTKILVQKAFVV